MPNTFTINGHTLTLPDHPRFRMRLGVAEFFVAGWGWHRVADLKSRYAEDAAAVAESWFRDRSLEALDADDAAALDYNEAEMAWAAFRREEARND